MNPPQTDESGTETRESNRRRFLRALGAVGIAGLAGCGGDGDGTDSPTGTDGEGTPTDTPDPTETDPGETPTDTPTETDSEETPTDTLDPTETEPPDQDLPDDLPRVVTFDASGVIEPGETTTVTATVENPYLYSIQSVEVGLEAPDADWTVEATGETALGTIETAGSVEVSWEVTAPEDASESVTLTGSVSYATNTDSAETELSLSISVFEFGDAPQDGLLAYYSFRNDFITVDTVSDLSGNGYDASVVGSVTYNQNTTTAGPSAEFSNSATMLIDDPGENPESYTVSCWMKTTASPEYYAFLAKSESFWCGTANETIDGTDTLVARTHPSDGASGGPVAGSTDIADGSWHHVVYVIDQDADQTQIYLDNTVEVTGEYNYGSSSEQVGIASKSDEADYFTGELAEIRYYDRPLSASEIDTLYQQGN
jgi:hypothetical protein